MKKNIKIQFTIVVIMCFAYSKSIKAQLDFGPSEPIPINADRPQSVYPADLDNDGYLDIVAASRDDDKIIWFRNDQNNSFAPQIAISNEADGAFSVYASDLDGDGDFDVLSTSIDDDKIAWYENDGDGNFGPQQIISSNAENPQSVIAKDLDGDGDFDVLSASNGDDKIAWYENDGNGGLGIEQIITTDADGANTVYASDLDNDGDLDVLSSSSGDDKIAWYENDGDGNFGAQQIISTIINNLRSVYASDLDNDGDMDVLSVSSNQIVWYQNDGNGGFGSPEIITLEVESANSVHTNDLDNDGDLDVLSSSAFDDKIAWYENDGDGNFGPQQIISTLADNAIDVYSSDFNGDGNIDVISASWFDDKIAWYENNGGGDFGPQLVITSNGFEAEDIFAADLDGDGDNDALIIAENGANDVIVWHSYQWNTFNSQSVIDEGINSPKSIYAADLDEDNDIDVLLASSYDKLSWYENDGGGNFGLQQVITEEANFINDIYVADLDGDGDMDVLSSSSSDDKIAWYENDGSGNFGPQLIITTNADAANTVFAADLDGDNDLDVLSSSSLDDKIAWYENDGNGGFSAEQVITLLADGASSVFASDLDGDGDQDVISTSVYDDKLAWYENDGNGEFSIQQVISSELGTASSLLVLDLDGDGDNDILLVNSNPGFWGIKQINWYLNDGSGSFSDPQSISLYTEINSIYAADIDGDNDLDILSALEDENPVWFENLITLFISVIEGNPACIGASTGSLQVTVGGQNYPPYTYEWSLDGGLEQGSGISEENNFIIEGLAAGTYELILYNSEQDTVIQQGIVLEGIAGSFFEIIDITTVNSTNEFPNGSIEITVDGGNPNYTYVWEGPSSGSSTVSSITDSIPNLYSGTYNITVTDNNNISIVQTVTLLDETVPGEICDSPLDVIILNDTSGSVDAEEYEESKEFYVDLINSLNVGFGADETRVSIVEWSDTYEQTLVEPFTGDTLILQNYVNANRTYDGGTNPNDALTFGYNYLQDEGRSDATWVIVLSTDGSPSQVSPSLVALSDEYQAEGVVISTIAFDGAYANPSTQAILQEVANIDVLAPGAPAYSQLDQDLANNIANLYICTSDPGTSNTYYFNRDGAIEINGYSPNEFCTDFSSVDIELTVTAQQQLSLPAGTPITFYYNNPATFAATPIITSFIPCAVEAGTSEILNYNLPITGPANVWAVLNDDGSQSPPINFPITDIEELVWVNNVDQIEVCTDPFPSVSALKYTTTPQPICDTIVMYTINVCNISSLDAVGVEVEDVAPDGFELLNISINDNGCAIGEGPFDLAVGCCVSLTYEYDASDAAVGLYDDQGVILNGPPEQVYYDFDASTTSAEDVTIGEILCDSDVVLFSKELNITEVCEESFVTYTFTIENQTNVALQALTFTDILPDPVIWAGEPYFVEGISLGVTDITNSNESNFIIAEIPADTIGIFYMDAYLGTWEESGLLSNTATLGNLSDFVNGDGANITANAADVIVNALPIIETENELTICSYEGSVSLSADMLNGDSIQWLSGGDGAFSDANSETVIYTFGAEDLAQGSVNLTISASTEDCGESNEGIVLELEECELDCTTLDPIVFEYNEDCDPVTEIYTLTMQVSGGLPSFDSNEYYSINGYYNDDDLSASETFQIIIDDVTDGTIIEFWATDVLGCQGYESIVVECIKLPIELLSFSGYANGQDNILEWQTASEMEVSFYEVERSFDGMNFERIGKVEAKGNESIHTAYSYIDESVECAICYYRLVWNDGVSNIIQINRGTTELELWQYSDQIIIEADVEAIELVNVMGQVVVQTNNNRLYVGDLASGVYLVKVLINGEYFIKKIVR